MSLTYGFYNSVKHDRVYNAIQMSSIFDGIIQDGVYQSIGDAFSVKPGEKNGTITVGSGRAWFNHTWTLNDARLSLDIPDSSAAYDRIDSVVIEVDASEEVRANSIKYVLGIPSNESPAAPTLKNTELVHQYPLANIYRAASTTAITQDKISNMVGTSRCPFVIGVLKTLTIDMFVAQWSEQWNRWISDKKTEANNDFNNFLTDKKLEFDDWFKNLEVTLSGDVAANLAAQVASLNDTINQLVTQGTINKTIDDSNGLPITDSSGNNLVGTLTYNKI